MHARQRTVAKLATTTGELVNRTLMHEGNEVRDFYSQLPRPVLVGIKAIGPTQYPKRKALSTIHIKRPICVVFSKNWAWARRSQAFEEKLFAESAKLPPSPGLIGLPTSRQKS